MDDTVGPAVDEVEVARVDAEPGGLADDEHRVEPVDRVRQQRHAAAHREEPKVARHDALLRALRRDPLDEKARREERLAEQTDAEPYLFRRHRGNPRDVATLGRALEHRAQDVVRLADLLGTPTGRDEREDLLGLLTRHRGGLVADVGEVAEWDLEGGGDVVQAVERDRLLATLDLADELPAQAGTVALDQCALPDGEVPNLGHLHERHQRGSFDASSMMRRSSSTETAPSTRRPLTNSVGVAKTPSAAACSMSASTSGAKRRSSTHRVKTARSRPRVLA